MSQTMEYTNLEYKEYLIGRERNNLQIMEERQVNHSSQILPSWAWSTKPFSIAQTKILCEINAGGPRRSFDWEAHIVKQLHRSRAQSQCDNDENQGKVIKGRGNAKSSSIIVQQNGSNQHLELKGSVLELVDGKFLSRQNTKPTNVFPLLEIQPELTNFVSKDIRTLLTIRTDAPTTIVQDHFDVFYYAADLDTTSDVLQHRLLHPTLFLIPQNGTKLHLYSLITGKLDYSYKFEGPIKYKKVTFFAQSGTIVASCVKATLPKGIFDDCLVFSYPPLRLISHIQVTNTATKESRATSVEFCDEYLIAHCSKERIIVCDLEKLLTKSKVVSSNSPSSPSHLITEFTDILVQVKSSSAFLSFDPGESPHYFIKRSKEIYELVRLTTNGPVKVDTADVLHVTDASSEAPASFLRNHGPRFMWKEKGIIRIWAIVDCAESKSKLSPLFHKDYNCTSSTGNSAEVPRIFKRAGLRETVPILYNDEEVTLVTSENDFLMQLAVVRFAEGSITCYIYDSFSYDLQYKVKPLVFSPRKDDMYDAILVHFLTNFVAVHKTSTSGEKRVYTFNLLRSLL